MRFYLPGRQRGIWRVLYLASSSFCEDSLVFMQLQRHPTKSAKKQQSAGEAIWTGHAWVNSVILSVTLLGLILDSTGFAKPKVHAEGRLAS